MMLARYRCLQWVFTLLFVITSSSFAGEWKQVTQLPTWRIGGAAAAVGGKIYLIGGFDHETHIGGRGPALSTVDVYDTRTHTWHAAAEMPIPRIASQTAVLSTEIYVFGGYDYKGPWGVKRYHKTVEVYDTQTDTWVKKRDMLTRRMPFAAAVVDGKIYLIGGTRIEVKNGVFGGKAITDLVEVYDPLTDRWEKRADMPTARSADDAVVVDSKIYVLGGQTRFDGDLAGRFVTRIEAYNPKTDQWHQLRDMPMFKFGFSTVAVDNEIYMVNGMDNALQRIDVVDVYNPTVDKWREIEPPTIPTEGTTVVVVNGTIYTLGGLLGDFGFSPIVEAFDTGFRAVTARGKLLTHWGELKAEHQR